MIVDPIVGERIYCLHDEGIDSIVLHFLPFTSQASGKEESMKTPSVHAVLSTCSGKSSRSYPLHGFLALSDSFGSSWVMGLAASRECILLQMETWNFLLTHTTEKGRSPVCFEELKEMDTHTIISKELLAGPKAVILPPSAPNLRSVTANSTEGWATLHQYFKLFHENYVEYAHKVYFELQHHVPHLRKIIDNQHSRLRKAQQKLLEVEKKQEKSVLHKKPLSKAEQDFKSELNRFAVVEMDALHSSIEDLNARLRRHVHSPQTNFSNQQKQKSRRMASRVQEDEVSQLKSSLAKLSLLNSENTQKWVKCTQLLQECFCAHSCCLIWEVLIEAAPEREQMGTLRLKDNKDEELALFQEMRKREKERNNLLLLQNSDEFDAPLGSRLGSSPIFNITSATPAPVRKTGADDFLNSDNEKNDYEWLLTPPGTPLFPSLEMESQKTVKSQLGTPKVRPAALKSRLGNSQSEPASRSNLLSRQPASSLGLNTSTGALRRPSSSGGPGSRPATPTGRPTLSSTSRSTSTSASDKPTLTTASRPATITSSKVISTTSSKPSRSATPTSRASLPSAKPTVPPRSATPTSRATLPSAKPTVPPRSSTPTTRSTIRSSTPTTRQSLPAPKSTSRASNPDS
ncbi:Uncharacterized protein Adt_02706 [Abeliophyllum distichum]|uniref:Uncharacterized protein n=1 Tax=Abeliophyllum distichum TaxID=126358 RepID=A0ABD1VYU5_9LAMI